MGSVILVSTLYYIRDLPGAYDESCGAVPNTVLRHALFAILRRPL